MKYCCYNDRNILSARDIRKNILYMTKISYDCRCTVHVIIVSTFDYLVTSTFLLV